MARDTQALLLQMSADLRRFEKSMGNMSVTASKRLTEVERRAQQADKNLTRIMGRAGENMTAAFRDSLRGIAPIIAGAFSAQAVQRYADSYIELQNRLRVTGLEGEALAAQYKELDRVATDSRSSLEATVNVYSRLRLASEGLGLSNEDVTRTTEIMAKALSASGASASETAAALLQFGQAIGSGVLQGDELRSIRENAPAIARAIAAEFNTTVGGLKKLGEEGALTSERVIQAVLKSGAQIDAMFDKTTATVGSAFTYLSNKFITYIGEADQTLGATDKIIGAIRLLAENLDAVATVAGVAVTVIGTRWVIATVAATASNLRYQASLLTMAAAQAGVTRGALLASTALGAMNGALAFFGGPIGLAITGVAVALSLVAIEAGKASAETKRLESQYIKNDAAQRKASQSAAIVAQASEKVRSVASEEEIVVASLTGEVGLLEDANYRLAASYKAREIAALRAKEAEIGADLLAARKNYDGVVGRSRARNISPTGGGATIGSMSIPQETARDRKTAEQVARESKEFEVYMATAAAVREATAARVEAESRALETFIPDLLKPPVGAGVGGKDDGKAQREADLKERLENERRLIELEASGDQKALQAEKDRQREAELTKQYTESGSANAAQSAKEHLGYETQIRLSAERRAKFEQQAADALSRLGKKADEYVDANQKAADRRRDELEYTVRIAQLQGDQKGAKAAQRELDITRRTAELRNLGVDKPEEVATKQIDALINAEDYKDMRTKFGAAFSEGIRAAMSGDLMSFFENMVGSATERALQKYGEGLFDSLGLGDLFGLDDAANAGTETALAQVAVLQPAFTTASLEMATAITTAGSAAAAAMAAAIATASVGNSLASLPSFAGGGYTGNSSRSGGLDGKGGFLAVMHPQENVTDLTKNMPDPSRMINRQSGAQPAPVHFDLRGAVVTEDLLNQMNNMVSSGRAVAVSQSVSAVKKNLPGWNKALGQRGTI